jgi:hypothetical protein
VRQRRSEDHPTPGRLLFAPVAQLVGEPVLDVDVPLFEYADAVARGAHLLRGVQLQLDDARAVDFLLHAGSGVLAADFARLVEHVRRYFADVRPDEYLMATRMSITLGVTLAIGSLVEWWVGSSPAVALWEIRCLPCL